MRIHIMYSVVYLTSLSASQEISTLQQAGPLDTYCTSPATCWPATKYYVARVDI